MITTYFFDDDEPVTFGVILGLLLLTGILGIIAIVVIPCAILWSWVTHQPETHFKRNAPYTGVLIYGLGLFLLLFPNPPIALNWIRLTLFGTGVALTLSTVYACRNIKLRVATLVIIVGLEIEIGLNFLHQYHLIADETAYLLGALTYFYLIYAPWALMFFGNQSKQELITIP
ncbi:MAG: hypothetical protein HZC01_00600 [Candidatus Kerfeldbacteria bacterium]|nr:hypothetical protein [Candidatus Kerfeldbacteria bacterium]